MPTFTHSPAPPADDLVGDAPQDLAGFLTLLWRGKWTLLACVLLLPAAVYGFTSQLDKTYESSVDLQIQAQGVDTSLFTTEAVPPERTLAAAARLVQTTGVAEEAARGLSGNEPPRQLLKRVRVTPDPQSGFMRITAEATRPQRAAETANAFATAIVATRTRSARGKINQAIDELQAGLDAFRRGDEVERRQLSQQIQRLRALRAAQGNNAEIIEPAVPEASPVAPNPIRNTALAFIVALLLGVGFVILRDRLNRKVRSADELERLSGVPVLGTLPVAAFPGHGSNRETEEAFQFLRASLTYFNVDRELTSVLVTSPFKGDGKTTVATHLAEAFALSGKDVILLDADMRASQAASRAGVAGPANLGTLLIGNSTLDESLVDAEIEPGRMRVLPAGPPPPNPSELLGSERMKLLLTELTDLADMVIIDTPPMLVVSDAIPMLEQVSGVVIVGRIGQTTRDAVSRLATVTRSARGHLLGVAATGGRGGGLYGRSGGYYGYGAENGDGLGGAGAGRTARAFRRFSRRS